MYLFVYLAKDHPVAQIYERTFFQAFIPVDNMTQEEAEEAIQGDEVLQREAFKQAWRVWKGECSINYYRSTDNKFVSIPISSIGKLRCKIIEDGIFPYNFTLPDETDKNFWSGEAKRRNRLRRLKARMEKQYGMFASEYLSAELEERGWEDSDHWIKTGNKTTEAKYA